MALADAGRGNYVLCQVTSNPYSSSRPGKLFTANRSLLRTKVGNLIDESFEQIVRAIIGLLHNGTADSASSSP